MKIFSKFIVLTFSFAKPRMRIRIVLWSHQKSINIRGLLLLLLLTAWNIKYWDCYFARIMTIAYWRKSLNSLLTCHSKMREREIERIYCPDANTQLDIGRLTKREITNDLFIIVMHTQRRWKKGHTHTRAREKERELQSVVRVFLWTMMHIGPNTYNNESTFSDMRNVFMEHCFRYGWSERKKKRIKELKK